MAIRLYQTQLLVCIFFIKNRLRYILGIILVACIVIGLRAVCSRPENEAVASLGKHYTKEALYVNDGWTDGIHAYKYNYSKVALDTDGVLKVMTDASKAELLGYIDNFDTQSKVLYLFHCDI